MEGLISIENDTRVLFVGEGNFSFSTLLTGFWQSKFYNERERNNEDPDVDFVDTKNIYSTCYESEPVSALAKTNIEILTQRGVVVLLGIDATKNFEKSCMQLRVSGEYFDKIIFMFPHIGGKMKIKKNRELLSNFAKNVVNYLNPLNSNSQVIITLCGGQGGTPFDPVKRSEPDTWKIVKMLSHGNLQLVSIGMLDIGNFINTNYDSYASYGYRGKNKSFHIENGVVHVFEISKIPFKRKEIDYNPPNYGQRRSLQDLKDEYVKQKIVKLFNQKSIMSRTLEHFFQFTSDLYKGNVNISHEPIYVSNINDFLDKRIQDSKLSSSESETSTLIEILIEQEFAMNFSKCPVTPYILVKHCYGELKDRMVKHFSSGFLLSRHDTHLFSLNRLSISYISLNCAEYFKEFAHQDIPWQVLWTTNKSLYSPNYSHCLSFWLPNHENRYNGGEVLDKNSLATIIWCCGYDTIISCDLIDVYKEGTRISNTWKLHYQSYDFALSSSLALEIQTQCIAKTLNTIFNTNVR